MAEEKRIPGVTFHMDTCSERGLLTGKTEMQMQITAVVEDTAQFEKIKKKFEDGFTIHTIEDFKGQMIKVLKEDNSSYEQQIRELETKLLNERRAHEATRTAYTRLLDTVNFFKEKAGG
jgi:septal ring factor EnvC (AmiA/AmiB activator)